MEMLGLSWRGVAMRWWRWRKFHLGFPVVFVMVLEMGFGVVVGVELVAITTIIPHRLRIRMKRVHVVLRELLIPIVAMLHVWIGVGMI